MKKQKKISLTLFAFIFSIATHANTILNETLNENNTLVKAGDKYVTLLGQQRSVGEIAPNFKVVDENFSAVTLAEFSGKTVLVSVVPSLDTGVCSLQTKRFNEEASTLDDNIVLLTVSNDLPFAQKRFCKQEKVDKVKVLSDAVWRDFGAQYGLLIKDMGLLTRAIFIINSSGEIAYKEIVANISQHPNYETALKELTNISNQNAQQGL